MIYSLQGGGDRVNINNLKLYKKSVNKQDS